MSGMSWRRIVGQVVVVGLFAATLGYFSNRPTYRHIGVDQAVVKLSLRHAGQLVGECRERSAEELAGMPANMRAPLVCPRERSPLHVELLLNDELVLSEILPARGIHKDGRASMYRRLVVPAGEMNVGVRLKDRIDTDEFQYADDRTVHLLPTENLVIDFNGDLGAFEFSQAGLNLSDSFRTVGHPAAPAE